ncbi:TIGR01777 family protein [Hyunsoonleella sp. SJ7]|uniref:TIGR01777 family protein n=1 Tax=Hyunsoonleella aquatilis TaxID=2762758 RepID=A0A923KMA1_9FLAO|nr:TIGR01777 family oxidoreductase [Hyunsoonleella aquatilis]MBC3758825.1 TIGR01777 family protein [Hyunsoonleella aquatilis]
MRILITGATGMIGQEIVKLCHSKGYQINYLTTRKSKVSDNENYRGFYWNPNSGELDTACFGGVDAIIHLAGATISKRWTSSYKKKVLDSRVDSTQLLINALKGESHQIKQIVSASAIGIYPSSMTNYYDQTHKEISDSFLGQVTNAWEKAVDGFSQLNIGISKVRIGLVLSEKGGALKEMAKPIKYGVGAAFGNGKQWQSWIHIEDLSRLFVFLLEEKLSGIYNGVGPNPVSNSEMTKTIANVLNRPLFLPNIPKFFMKLVLGEMHIILFESQRVSSKKIESRGFVFKFHHLKPALEDLLV